jgi:SAM-dependent methyltransferase
MATNKTINTIDIRYLSQIRENIRRFLTAAGETWGETKGMLLDIAPQDHEGARPYFSGKVEIETLDINPHAGTTYCLDICTTNDAIQDDRFDIIVCTEVLEHVLNPFAAIAEIHRILKPGGILLASSPFNFRIHGPLPDCWRFTEHGWRVMLKNFEQLRIETLEDADRFLMPIHYTITAKKYIPD